MENGKIALVIKTTTEKSMATLKNQTFSIWKQVDNTLASFDCWCTCLNGESGKCTHAFTVLLCLQDSKLQKKPGKHSLYVLGKNLVQKTANDREITKKRKIEIQPSDENTKWN